jgi:hypothetical protein
MVEAVRHDLKIFEDGSSEREMSVAIGLGFNTRRAAADVLGHEHQGVAGKWSTGGIDRAATQHNATS